MKKSISIILILVMLFASCSTTFCGIEQARLASFPVTFNGVTIDNQHATYPLLVYKGITYFPMTWDFSSAFGLTTTYTEEKGLEIKKNGSPVEVVQSLTATNNFSSSYKVELPYFPVTVNGRLLNNAKEPYPVLHFRNITYFPLTWAFAVTEFGWDYSYSDSTGLQISAVKSVTEPDLTREHYKDTVTFENGDTYEGEFYDNCRDGFGTYLWVNGDKYIGSWVMDQTHGKGSLMWADGDTYIGDWYNGERTGKGLFAYADKTSYYGDFVIGSFHGKGTMKWPNGEEYYGDWKQNERTGFGQYTFSDGTIYTGYFLNGEQHGHGKTTFTDGSIIEGTWEYGEYITPTAMAPTGIIARGRSTSEIEVGWNSVTNANYYYLYYSSSANGPWYYFQDNNGNKRGLTWFAGYNSVLYDCEPGETTYFKVTAVINGVESDYSNITYATTFIEPQQSTTIMLPPVTASTIKSKISSDFEGFDSGNLYELSNGQIWKQTSYDYEYEYAFMPDVIIYKDGLQYKMHVEGCRKEITVERIY